MGVAMVQGWCGVRWNHKSGYLEAGLHPNEAKRLETLHAINILQTGKEQVRYPCSLQSVPPSHHKYCRCTTRFAKWLQTYSRSNSLSSLWWTNTPYASKQVTEWTCHRRNVHRPYVRCA